MPRPKLPYRLNLEQASAIKVAIQSLQRRFRKPWPKEVRRRLNYIIRNLNDILTLGGWRYISATGELVKAEEEASIAEEEVLSSFGATERACVTRDCLITIKGKIVGLISKEHPNCEVLCDLLKEAKKRLLSCTPRRVRAVLGYILTDLDYYTEQGIISETEREALVGILERMVDYL